MPSDHETCACEHAHGHSTRHEAKRDDGGKSKVKSTSPKVSSSAGKKKGRSKKKEEISADTILAKIAELEAGRAEAAVPLVPVVPAAVLAKVGLHIPSDLREKYLAQLANSARERAQIQTYENRIAQVQKEQEDIMAEVAKVEEKKQKLDNLCKQLQQRNKEILDAVRERGEEEQQKRKELSEKFSVTINEITARMEQQQQERLQMAAENDQLRHKIESMKQTIISREDNFKKMHDKKDEELAKLQQKMKDGENQALAEEQKFQEWRESMEAQGAVIDELRAQLLTYSNKFEHFQFTLTKSNPIFLAYKTEMDKITKRIRTLEQENQQMRLKIARADLQIVDLVEQRAKSINKFERLDSENERLQALAKELSAERTRLRALKAQQTAPVTPSTDAGEN